MTNKILFAFIVLILVMAGIFLSVDYVREQNLLSEIDSFEECASAGYPVMESYPPRCMTPDDRSFTQAVAEPPIPEYPLVNSVADLQASQVNKFKIYGTVEKGAKDYCSEGIFLTDETGTIMLKTVEGEKEGVLETFLGERVEVTGVKPEQDVYCQALICECEPYITVEELTVID